MSNDYEMWKRSLDAFGTSYEETDYGYDHYILAYRNADDTLIEAEFDEDYKFMGFWSDYEADAKQDEGQAV